jgi:hypothetical protein
VTPASPLHLTVLAAPSSLGGQLTGLAVTIGDQLVQDDGMVEHGSAPRW